MTCKVVIIETDLRYICTQIETEYNFLYVNIDYTFKLE